MDDLRGKNPIFGNTHIHLHLSFRCPLLCGWLGPKGPKVSDCRDDMPGESRLAQCSKQLLPTSATVTCDQGDINTGGLSDVMKRTDLK